jgi:hypothetical protein
VVLDRGGTLLAGEAYPPPGWVIWPASPEGGRRGRGTLGPDLVNAREMARRMVLGGYASSMGAHQIWKLARTDPNFPASWSTGGTERLWSWCTGPGRR